MLVDAGEAFEALPFKIRAGISKLIEYDLGAAPAIEPYHSSSANSPISGPADLHRTLPLSPRNTDTDPRTVGSKMISRLKDVERQRDELRAEVARPDTEKPIFIQDVHQLLSKSNTNDWQPDANPYCQILEFATIYEARARTAFEGQQTSSQAAKAHDQPEAKDK